jgi:hypothetical protein
MYEKPRFFQSIVGAIGLSPLYDHLSGVRVDALRLAPNASGPGEITNSDRLRAEILAIEMR